MPTSPYDSRPFLPFVIPRTTLWWMLRLVIISSASFSAFLWYSSSDGLHLPKYTGSKLNYSPGANDNFPDNAVVSVRRNASRILLVSALFPLTKSKHSSEEYRSWLTNFLHPITTPIYFYTTPAFAPIIQNARGVGLPITIDTTYSSPFDIPPLRELEETYTEMHELDREKFRHSPDLYAVWNAKPFFLDAAVKKLKEKGELFDYAFWNDAGSFRQDHSYTSWPDPWRIDSIWKSAAESHDKNAEDLLFFPIAALPPAIMRNWQEDMGPVDYDISEGSFFGGSPKTVSWWSQTYYTYHNYYLSRSLFVGKDQTLINALLLLFPSRILSVFYSDPRAPKFPNHLPVFDLGYLGACGSEWFYYQYWLANYEERKKMAQAWIKGSRWADWDWWRRRQECQLAKGENWEDLVRRVFGEEWNPPNKKVVVDSAWWQDGI